MSTPHGDATALDLPLLRAFATLCAERHVTRAARRLGVTQSALSHALGRLRRAFGDPLFVRTATGVAPTERAIALEPDVRRLLDDVARIAAPRAPFDPATLVRTFVIATADLTESIVVPALAAVLLRDAPRVDLVVRPIPDDLEHAFATAAIDLAFVREMPLAPHWRASKLFDDHFVTMMRRGHPALRKRLTAEAWAALPHALIAPRGALGGPVDEALAARGLARRVVVRLSTFHAAPLLAATSDLAVTMPSRLARAAMRGRDVVLMRPPVPVPGFRMDILWHERSRRDPALAWLRARIAEVVAAARPRRAQRASST